MSKSRDSITFENNYKNQFNQSIENRSNKRHVGNNVRRWRYLWSEVKRMFYNYCETTAMHGFRNIAVSQVPFEKFIWAIVRKYLDLLFAITHIHTKHLHPTINEICFAAVILSLILIKYSSESIRGRLMLIQLTNHNAPLNTLNFPAVTVCNYNKVYKPVAKAMENTLLEAGYSNEEIKNFFNNLTLLVRPNYIPFEMEKFNEMIYLLDNSLKNLMLRLMQPCENLLKSCYWIGNSYNCSLLFKPVDSLMGHCCGFNYQVATTYADQNTSPGCMEFYTKYDPDNKIQCNETECPGRKIILKTPGSGIDVGLTVELDVEKDFYLASTGHYMGACVIIHEAFEYPETDILTATIQPDQEANIVLSGTKIESLDDIRKYPPSERKCLFLDEIGHLYSYQSCIAGCKMNRILQTCDCIPYYYPETCIHIARTCDFSNVECLQKNLDNITKVYEDVTIANGKVLEKCNCKQVCSKTIYSISIDKIRMNHPQYSLPWNAKNNTIDRNMSKFNVYFQDYGYIKYTRSSYLAWNNVLANYGGILGLCIGASLISIIEPLIYLLLTPFRIIHHRQIRKTKAAKKRAEDECKIQFKDIPPASKLFKRVPADKKLLKEWQEHKNNIFIVGEEIERFERRRKNKQGSNKKKTSTSENVELFRTHFF